MTTYNCGHCHDTGHIIYPSGEQSAFLDCANCGVAKERAELAAFVDDFCANYSGLAELLPAELNWAIHQRGRDQAQPPADKLDAERYRWLRDEKTDVGNVIDKEFAPGMYEYKSGNELDEAIDAARASSSTKEGGNGKGQP